MDATSDTTSSTGENASLPPFPYVKVVCPECNEEELVLGDGNGDRGGELFRTYSRPSSEGFRREALELHPLWSPRLPVQAGWQVRRFANRPAASE